MPRFDCAWLRARRRELIGTGDEACFTRRETTSTDCRTTPSRAAWCPAASAGSRASAPKGVVNLAPYSFFNAVCHRSAHGGLRQRRAGIRTAARTPSANVEATGEFVCNLATFDLREQMSLTSATTAPEVDEFGYAGLEAAPATLVRASDGSGRLRSTWSACTTGPSIFPCRDPDPLVRNGLVIGEVVGVHISDESPEPTAWWTCRSSGPSRGSDTWTTRLHGQRVHDALPGLKKPGIEVCSP